MNPVSAFSWQQNFFWLKIKKIWWMWQRVVSQVILATCGSSIVMRHNWTLSINLCRSQFCLTECVFHPVVGSDALARFQKAVMDKANGRPPYCHHNLLLLFIYFFLVLYDDEAIEPIIYNCYKRSMTIWSKNGFL